MLSTGRAAEAPSLSIADVDCSASPAVRPDSMTSRRVIRATTPPIMANRPLAKRISRIARNTLFLLSAGVDCSVVPLSWQEPARGSREWLIRGNGRVDTGVNLLVDSRHVLPA